MKIIRFTSPPGAHEEMLRRSREAAANRETVGERGIKLTDEDEAILDRAWARLGAQGPDLATATDDELLAYSRLSRERDSRHEPPVLDLEDEAMLTESWQAMGDERTADL